MENDKKIVDLEKALQENKGDTAAIQQQLKEAQQTKEEQVRAMKELNEKIDEYERSARKDPPDSIFRDVWEVSDSFQH